MLKFSNSYRFVRPFSSLSPRSAFRRQKRWWNAYILFYERIDDTIVDLAKEMQKLSVGNTGADLTKEVQKVSVGKCNFQLYPVSLDERYPVLFFVCKSAGKTSATFSCIQYHWMSLLVR